MSMRKKPLFLLLLFLGAACSQQSNTAEPALPQQPQTAESPMAVSLPSTNTPEPNEEETAVRKPTDTPGASTVMAEIEGLVVAESDAGGIPDSPLGNQLVLIMTLETAERLFVTGSDLRFTQQEVPLDDSDIMTHVSAGDGTFTASVSPGETVLCLADENTRGVGTTRGCGQFTAHPGPNGVTISVGFGEILLETD